MIFLLKKELKGSGPFYLVLQKIFGVGEKYSCYLCSRAGISVKAFLSDITFRFVRRIGRLLVTEGVFEIELLRLIRSNIKRKISIKNYQGRRHLMGLPVRGQNTKNNSKTAKKKILINL